MKYVTLTSAQKPTIVSTQDQFTQNHKSIMIKSFTSEANTIPLMTATEEEIDMTDTTINTTFENMDLTTTTVLTFMACHYKAGDGTPLFSYVYSAIEDSIEVLVRRAYYAEAKECVLHLHKDLRHFSNPTSQTKNFHESVLNTNMVGYIPWQLFQ